MVAATLVVTTIGVVIAILGDSIRGEDNNALSDSGQQSNGKIVNEILPPDSIILDDEDKSKSSDELEAQSDGQSEYFISEEDTILGITKYKCAWREKFPLAEIWKASKARATLIDNGSGAERIERGKTYARP